MHNSRKFNTFIILFFLVVYCAMPIYALQDSVEDNVNLTDNKKSRVTNITFDEVVQRAKEHSYDLQISEYNELISKQIVRAYKSEYYPKANIGAGTEYTKNFRDERDTTVMSIGDAFINPYTRFQSILGINLGYNLFDFGVRGGNVKISKKDVEIKELQTKEKYQELQLVLLDSYSKILLTSYQIEQNKKILELVENNLKMQERLYKAKEISKTELNDAKIAEKRIKNRLSDLKSTREEALNWLSFYTGDGYDTENLKLSELEKCDFDENFSFDIQKSLVWKIYEKNIKKKELELFVAKRTNYPKVNVYGRYYLYGSNHNNWAKSMGIEPSNLSVGASVNIPVFDGFKNSANIQKTSLELKQLFVERDKAVAQLETRLATMRANLIYLSEQNDENMQIAKELQDKAKSVYKLVENKIVSPIDENNLKIEILNHQMDSYKNKIMEIAITHGIKILTDDLSDIEKDK